MNKTNLDLDGILDALQAIIPRLTEWEASHPEERSVVLVAGPTGCGKTTFAKQTQNGDTTLLSLDRYFVPGVQPPGKPVNWSGPDVLDAALIASDITAMLQMPIGTEYSVPIYDIKKSERTGFEKLKLKRRLVVEGVYTLRFLPELETHFKIYIDASPNILLERKMIRDTNEREIPREEVFRRFHENVLPAIQQYVLPQKTMATYIVNNDLGQNGVFPKA